MFPLIVELDTGLSWETSYKQKTVLRMVYHPKFVWEYLKERNTFFQVGFLERIRFRVLENTETSSRVFVGQRLVVRC